MHSFNEREMHDFEKKARGVGYFNTKGGYTGTGVIVRQSLQNMGIEHVKIDNPILENRLTHLKITSNETFHIISVYGSPNRMQTKGFFYCHLKDYVQFFSHFRIIMAGDFKYVENDEVCIIQMNKSEKLVKRTLKPKN